MKKIFNSKIFLQTFLACLITVCAVAAMASATTIGTILPLLEI